MVCRRMLLGRGGEMCYLNKLLMVSVLGWLFQVSFSGAPEGLDHR